MAKGIIQNITEEFKSYNSNILLIENNDLFLYRQDVIKALKSNGVDVVFGTPMQLRVHFELREKESLLVMLVKDKNNILDDVKQKSITKYFSIEQYFNGYHTPSIIELDIKILDKLFEENQLVSLNKVETIKIVENIKKELQQITVEHFDLDDFIVSLNKQLAVEYINWGVVCRMISSAILNTIGTTMFEELLININRANDVFQETIKLTYQQTKNSSSVKSPKIVSKILDYLSFNFLENKIALIVIDGLSFWQYELLKDKLPLNKNEEVIYSWIPSITQLSRQAIFKGDIPLTDYKQGPVNEEKLWKSYWNRKGTNEFEIRYNHETINLTNLDSITKFAIVFKDLDEKMHSSTDYKDLLKLTENWIERSKISIVIQELRNAGFKIFITTDHGNIQAKGWRGLQGREKLGTNKSGSRSERHIEYSEQWLSDEFIKNNPDLEGSVALENQAIYFKNDLSFSSKDALVTHGGSHLLEVLIPFIEINNDK